MAFSFLSKLFRLRGQLDGGGLEGGRAGRRLRHIPGATREVNQQIRQYGKTLVARSRYLALNNPYGSQARDTFVSSMIGTGITPSPMTKDPELKNTLRQAFDLWTDQADADWLTDFYGLQAIIAGEMFEAGECFVRLRQRRPEDGLAVPFQIQVLPSEMVPVDYNADLGSGRKIQCGIQFDALGRRELYWFYPIHPGSDLRFQGFNIYDLIPVPASEVLHLYRPIRAGQVRGLPHTIAAITTLAMMDLYDDAELERKKTAALFGGFITRPNQDDEDHPFGSQSLLPPDVSDPLGKGNVGEAPVLEPGAMVDLNPGEDIKFSEPADVGANYEPFQYRNLLRSAAGFGVPYADMTGDLHRANYGSIRAGMITFRRRITWMQHSIMAYQFCRPVWNRWLENAILANSIAGITPLDYTRRQAELRTVRWIPPAWEWIDPLKDLAAEKIAVDNRFKPRSMTIEEQGLDPEEVDDRIAEDQERLATRNIPPAPLGGSSGVPSEGDSGGGSSGGGRGQ